SKKSHGRKVPVALEFNQDDQAEAEQYICTYEGCGKCFIRCTHLKRHVKSLHLDEKPPKCPHEDCKKSFGRKDNLKKHMGSFH
ncbi:uncharacterized protein BT62DRAFT_903333, partial [Guyanagaster necrorhizus]